jgi:hypothetical protein
MTELIVAGLVVGAFLAGHFYQFVRDARSAIGTDKHDKK